MIEKFRMSKTPDYKYRVSERLSEVMADIGVDTRLVMKRRRAMLVHESIYSLRSSFDRRPNYIFGSQSEGSTTLGLGSDIDSLVYDSERYNIIQNLSEWKHGAIHFMMIQNENISPGYCYLQIISNVQPLPVTTNVFDKYDNVPENIFQDNEGGFLLKNTMIISGKEPRGSRHYHLTKVNGPALTVEKELGIITTDLVVSLYCKSSPYQVTSWLQKQRKDKWPPEDTRETCRNAGCFLVAVISKASDTLELEWRISTSLQERYLMFSLNITQLRCYVLMKMILKTHINPHVEDVLTSFMCKNVLLFCIANSSHDWHTGNLLSYLHLCLFMLKECVQQRNCPHFIIPENNLLAGRMTDTHRGKLLDIINNLIKNDQFLFMIQIDDLGIRLKIKLNMLPKCRLIANDSTKLISQTISCVLVFAVAFCQNKYLQSFLDEIKHESLERAQQATSVILSFLEKNRKQDNKQLQTASELLIPLVSSTLGSILASMNIDTQKTISDEALTYLEAGRESDALSGRLKLFSVLYCTGDMKRVEDELRIFQTQYNISSVVSVCDCYYKGHHRANKYFMEACDEYDEEAIKYNIAFCTKFLQCEMNCVPHELRYEIFRSYIEDDSLWKEPEWMDVIVVDAVPYLHFLQYKTYRYKQRWEEQAQALRNLEQSTCIVIEHGLGHTETALNLLGQCLEQEDMPARAFQCYIYSLKHRARHNAARLLLCIQLFKLWKQQSIQ